MATPTIDPIRVDPVGDDQQWKRDVKRAISELINQLAAARTEIDYLKGRIK